jgi:hypothetical protein
MESDPFVNTDQSLIVQNQLYLLRQHFSYRNGSIEYRDLVEATFPRCLAGAVTSEEELLSVDAIVRRDRGTNLWCCITIQIDSNLFAIADQQHVVPCPTLDRRSTGSDSAPIAEDELPWVMVTTAKPKVFAADTSIEIMAP